MRRSLITVGTLLCALSCERPRPVVRAEDARRPSAVSDARDGVEEVAASFDRSPADAAAPLDAAAEESAEAPEPPTVSNDDPYAGSCFRVDIDDPTPMPTITVPEVPPELRSEVSRLRPLVARCMRCFRAERVAHVREPDCSAWAGELMRSGLAGMHAVGQLAFDEQNGRMSARERALTQVAIRVGGMPNIVRGGGNTVESAAVIAPLLASYDAREVLPYMLAALNRFMYCQPPRPANADVLEEWMANIAGFVGFDPAPVAPWQEEPASYERRSELAYDAFDRWLRWHRSHQHESLEQWRARALEHNRRALTSPLVVVRVDAILRLSGERAAPEDREASRQTLLRLLENRRVPNAAKRYLRGYAARQGWQIDAEASDAGATTGGDGGENRGT